MGIFVKTIKYQPKKSVIGKRTVHNDNLFLSQELKVDSKSNINQCNLPDRGEKLYDILLEAERKLYKIHC